VSFQFNAPDKSGCGRIAELLDKYRDLDPDWADVSLVWLAESLRTRRIATVDVRDFSVYRIHGKQRFELEVLRG
jgi:predicted nucleic acid-binding protein